MKYTHPKINKKFFDFLNQVDKSHLSNKDKSIHLLSLLYNEVNSLGKENTKALSSFTSSLSDFILLDKNPNKVIYDFLKELPTKFEEFINNQKTSMEKIKNHKTNKKMGDAILSEVVLINYFHEMNDFFTQLLKSIESEKKLVSKNTKIKPSNLYPLKNTRISMASKCVKSSVDELNKILMFLDDIDISMTDMFVSDCFNHYHLGVLFLDGDPKGLLNASHLDTASRDSLKEGVLDFAMSICYKNGKYTDKAIKEHREKLKIRQVKNSANKIKKHIQSNKSDNFKIKPSRKF